jgi:hypothetical protein
MTLKPGRTYRLIEKGRAGLTCDAQGAALGGIPLAWAQPGTDGAPKWRVRPRGELADILGAAYRAQQATVVDRCHRGLQRIVARLETGDFALAGIEALMLRPPQIDVDGMAKLAAMELHKAHDAWENEPRLPAGQTGGGQWTSGAGGGERMSAGETPSNDRPDRPSRPTTDGSDEDVVVSPVRESRRQGPNGFYPNSAGGGVFYLPTTSGGHQVRPTEIHAFDAAAFQVGWADGTIELKDPKGRVFRTGTTPTELQRFNATTGRTLGVSIYAFPDTPLGSPEGPPTVEEQRRLAEEQAAQDAGTQASIQSPSGRVTSVAVGAMVALPLLALAPVAAETAPELSVNTAEGLWPESEQVGVSGSRPISQARAYESGIRAQYPEGGMSERVFSTMVNGERVSGVADGAAEIHGENTAIESKYVANWSRSIRNPLSRSGKTSWGLREQARMISQARKYSDNFDGGVVYHTNSRELASYYYQVFRSAGITRFRFVITPVGK